LRSVAIALVRSSVSAITKALVRVVAKLLLRQAEQASAAGAAALSQLVQLGRDPRAETGARSVTRATAPGCLLAGTSQAIGKRLCGRIVGTSVAPEYVPKHNSELSGNRGRRPDDAVRLEIGEEEVRD
jgi:hypothetical protein